jgi:hypothetical protein
MRDASTVMPLDGNLKLDAEILGRSVDVRLVGIPVMAVLALTGSRYSRGAAGPRDVLTASLIASPP